MIKWKIDIVDHMFLNGVKLWPGVSVKSIEAISVLNSGAFLGKRCYRAGSLGDINCRFQRSEHWRPAPSRQQKRHGMIGA